MLPEAAAPAPANPFKGLRPFDLDDRHAIFGRDMDFTLMRERLYSARTTLLFAGSGVGKTSFLRARLLPSIQNEFVTCYHRDWADEEPRVAVLRSISTTLRIDVQPDTTLMGALGRFTRKTEASTGEPRSLPLRPSQARATNFLLVLDQFEEVFQHYSFRDEFRHFLDQLCDVITADEVCARVVISMRDDFLGALSVFDNRIPDIFNNYYRLKSPSKTQAAEIIVRTAALVDRKVDAASLNALVDDLATFRRALPRTPAVTEKAPPPSDGAMWRIARIGRRIGRMLLALVPVRKERRAPSTIVEREFVVLPYLQIVCHELWESAADKTPPFPSNYPTASNRSNAASGILDTFCRTRLNGLKSTRQRDLAARAFDFLMTRDGAKMAYQLGRLAEHMDVKQGELEPVLDTLSDVDKRILRRFKGSDGSWWYELYHDMYAWILYEWKRWYQARRARQRQAYTYISIIAIVLLLVAATRSWTDWQLIDDASEDFPRQAYDDLKRRLTLGGALPWLQALADEPWADYWDRRAARAEQAEDRDRALLFRLQALDTRATEERRAAVARLAAGEYDSHLHTTLRAPGTAAALFFSPDDRLLLASTIDGLVHVWDIKAGRSLGSFSVRAADDGEAMAVEDAVFLPQGSVLTLTRNGLQRWEPQIGGNEWRATGGEPAATAFAFSDARQLFVAVRGSVIKHDLANPEAALTSQEGLRPRPAPSQAYLDAVVAAEAVKAGPDAAYFEPAGTRRAMQPASDLPAIRKVVLVPGQSRILTADDAGQVCTRNVASLERAVCFVRGAVAFDFDAAVQRIAILSPASRPRTSISGGGRASGEGTFQLYDFNGGRVGAAAPVPGIHEADVVFGHKVVQVFRPGSVTATFDAQTGERIGTTAQTEFPRDRARTSPAGLVAHQSGRGVWITNSENRLQLPIIRTPANAVAFSPSGSLLVTASEGAVRLWNPKAAGPAPADFLSVNGRAAPISFSGNGRCAVYADARGQLLVHNLTDGSVAPMADSAASKSAPSRVAIDDGCTVVAGALADGTLKLWSVASGKPVGSAPLRVTVVPVLLFSRDGTRLLAWSRFLGSSDYVLVNATTGTEIARLPASTRSSFLNALRADRGTPAFTADSQFVVVTSPRTPTQVFSAVDGKPGRAAGAAALPMGTAVGASGDIVALATRDGLFLVSASASPVANRLSKSAAVRSVAFSPDRSRAVAVEGGALRIYDVASRGELPAPPPRRFATVSFHQKDPTLAVAASATGVQLLDLSASPPRYRGLPVSIGSSVASADDEDGDILSIEFSESAEAVIVATSQWLHRLTVTDAGLEAAESRQLSAPIVPTTGVRILDARGFRVAAGVQLGAVASRVEVIDFRARPVPTRSHDLRAWERKLGLHLEQGDITVGASASR